MKKSILTIAAMLFVTANVSAFNNNAYKRRMHRAKRAQQRQHKCNHQGHHKGHHQAHQAAQNAQVAPVSQQETIIENHSAIYSNNGQCYGPMGTCD